MGLNTDTNIPELQFRAALKHLEDLLACCESADPFVAQMEDPEAFRYLERNAKAFLSIHRLDYPRDWEKDLGEAVL